MSRNALLHSNNQRKLARSRSLYADSYKYIYPTTISSSNSEVFKSVHETIIISENKTLASTEGSSSICRNFKRRYDKYNYFTGKYEEKGFRLMITSTSKFLRLIATLCFLLAFVYHQEHFWQLKQNRMEIMASLFCILITLTLAVVLMLCFGLKEFSKSVMSFWMGYTFALIFTTSTKLPLLNATLRKYILFGSVAWDICELLNQFLNTRIKNSTPILWYELSCIFGFWAGNFQAQEPAIVVITLQLISTGALIGHLRMKTIICLLVNVGFVIISCISVIRNCEPKPNMYSLIIFFVFLITPNILDVFFFNKTSPLETWDWFLKSPWWTNVMAVLFASFYNIVFFVYAIQKFGHHATFELTVIIPLILTTVVGLFTTFVCNFCFQFSLLRKMYKSKKRKMNDTKRQKVQDIIHLASDGFKCLFGVGFKIKSAQTFCVALFGFVCWQREDAFYTAFYLMLIALESFSLCRFQHLQTYLGGTSIGLGLIAPSVNMTQNGNELTFLPTNSIENEYTKVQNLLGALSLYFSSYLIQNFGCEYIAKTTAITVESKLRQFFGQKTHNRFYDNYFLYLNGLTSHDGSLLLPGNTSLSVDRLLAQWRSKFGENSHSKLIILLDVPDGSQWLTAVYNTKTQKVALQTVKYTESSGEMGHFFSLYFTTKWIQFNKNNIFEYKQVTSTLTDRGITCFYSLSLPWRKNQLISCTDDEFKIQVSRMTCVPCFDLLAVSIACGEFMVKLLTLDKIIKNCRRVRMKWFSPKVFSIAQGIKLFKS